MIKSKAGRKKIQLDTKQAEIFGYFKATYETMADYLGVHVQTIRERMNNDVEFFTAYKKGLSSMKMKLSEAQLQTALKGNATMLIWLGKQYLGQKEPENNLKEENEIEIPQDLENMSVSQINELYERINGNNK